MNAESIKETQLHARKAPLGRQARCLIVTPDTQFGQRLARILEKMGCDSYAVLETVLDDTSFDADCVFFDLDDIFYVEGFISLFPREVSFIPFRGCGEMFDDNSPWNGGSLNKNWPDDVLYEKTLRLYDSPWCSEPQLQCRIKNPDDVR